MFTTAEARMTLEAILILQSPPGMSIGSIPTYVTPLPKLSRSISKSAVSRGPICIRLPLGNSYLTTGQ